jgi:hypothetical protein
MIRVLKVYRYRSSNKFVALGLGNGYVFPLNADLTVSGKDPHRVRRGTELEETPYRIEIEVVKDTYRVIRTWNQNHLPPKSVDPNLPLEQRIDISPSQEFNSAEREYTSPSDGHVFGYLLIFASFFLCSMTDYWGWWPPLTALGAGITIAWFTIRPGDASKILEVKEAKERVRGEAQRKFYEALRDVNAWASLDGIGFERAVAVIYREQGFNVEFTSRTNDRGVDLILRKGETVSIVQCKAYAKSVGVSAVRELVGTRASWPNPTEAILVSLFDFSGAAKAFAAEHNIKLYSVAKEYLKTDYRP